MPGSCRRTCGLPSGYALLDYEYEVLRDYVVTGVLVLLKIEGARENSCGFWV